MKTEQRFCQSCGMPLNDVNDYGTNADGSRNDEYCKYCYENGRFKQQCTMEEMIETCVPHITSMTPDEARHMMQEWFPTLKRWQK